MTFKLWLSLCAIGLTLVGFAPYIDAILRGRTKPHVFSWVIWGLTTCVVFWAQLQDHGGVGAWPIGVSGVVTIGIACLAYMRRSDVSITKLDWVFFVGAMAALPFWYITRDPLWAVVVLTIVDLCGFGPTLRKVYWNPYSENIPFFMIFAVRNVMVMLALQHYSVTTVLFPLATALACVVLIVVVLYRRGAEGVHGMEPRERV